MSHCEWLGRLITVHRDCIVIRGLKQQAHPHSRDYDLQEISSSQCEFTRVLACRSIVDSFSGCRAPHLLVAGAASQQGPAVPHQLLVLDHQGRFQECGLQFEVKTSDLPTAREGESQYHLLHGPTVVWNQETRIHIAHGEDMKQVTVEVEKIAPELKLDKIRNMWCMTWSGTNGGLPCVLLLLQLLLKGVEFGTREWLCLQVQLPGDCSILQPSSAAVTKLHRDMIPLDYGCIAKCIATHREHCADGRRGGVLEKMVFLVGTEHQQLVLIDGGIPRHIISLQNTPQRLIAVKGCRSGSVEVAVKYSSGTVSVYEMSEEGAEEKGTWNDIAACLSGDFAGVGCNQILLLSNTETLSSYFLSENRILHPYQADDAEGGREPHPDTPKSVLNILRALNLKKHTMEAQLTQQQSTLQHKYTLLARTLGFMESLGNAAVTTAPTKPDPGLVCLLPGSAEVDKELANSSRILPGSSQGQLAATSDLLVWKVWQRIHQGKHVIGMLIKNLSKTLVVGVGASVMSSGSCDPLPTESICKVVWHERKPEVSPTSHSDGSNSPPTKRRRLAVLVDSHNNDTTESRACDLDAIEPGMSFCLTVVTGSDAVSSELVVVGLWQREGVEAMQTEELTRVQLTSRQMCSGELAIDHSCLAQWNGSAILSGECNFHAQETQDLLCLLATSSLAQVSVSTGHTELYRLPSMIRARLPLPQHGLQTGPSFSHHCTAPASNTTAPTRKVLLEGMALHIQLQPAMDTAVISILYKCHSDLCLVLKLLRDLLPGDLRFKLLCESGAAQYQALQQALGRTREEISQKVEKLEGILGEMAGGEGATGGGRRGMVTTPTSLCEPRLEMATDAALSQLHA